MGSSTGRECHVTERPPMLEISTTGSPFERGQQQGVACRERALPWLKRTLRHLTQLRGAPTSEAAVKGLHDEIGRWRDHAAQVDADAIEESRGLAAGLGLDEETYFVTQFFPVLTAPRHCTTTAFRDATGRPLLGKTDDIARHELGMNVLETARPDRGYRHSSLHFAGTAWTVAGMNECGLAIAMTGIPGPTLDQPGLPEPFATRAVLLTCANVREALDWLGKFTINWYGVSLLLGDADGTLALIEKNGVGMARLPEQDGALVHTNHILDPHLAAHSPPQIEPYLTNGRRRLNNVHAELKTLPRTEAGMRLLYSNRSPDGAIWQTGEDGMHTDFAIVLVPTEKRFTVWTKLPDHYAGIHVGLKKQQ